jgi:hypothetical protein
MMMLHVNGRVGCTSVVVDWEESTSRGPNGSVSQRSMFSFTEDREYRSIRSSVGNPSYDLIIGMIILCLYIFVPPGPTVPPSEK